MTDLAIPIRAEPATAGLFVDFDGTLSEIVDVPSAARPLPGATHVLNALARRYPVVAVVSGRSAHQLLEWLGPHVEIWGLHGAETARDGRVVLADRAIPFRDLMATVAMSAAAALEDPVLEGVRLEDKGVMLALHWRTAADRERSGRAASALARRLADEHGLVTADGRLVVELRPPAEFTKRAVVLERARAERLSSAAFVGDDRVDLAAFDALDELEREGIHALRVAVRSTEAPRELIARADLVVDGPVGALTFLRSLL